MDVRPRTRLVLLLPFAFLAGVLTDPTPAHADAIAVPDLQAYEAVEEPDAVGGFDLSAVPALLATVLVPPPINVPNTKLNPPKPVTVVTPLPLVSSGPSVVAPTPLGPSSWTYSGPPVGPTNFVRTPEPGTLLSGLVGAAVLAFYRRRRPPIQPV